MRNFVITISVVAVLGLLVGFLTKCPVGTKALQSAQKDARAFLQKHDIRKKTATMKLAGRITKAKAGSYDLMYQLWRGLTLTQGVSIEDSEPKPQVTEDVMRQERMQLIRTKLPSMQANMAAILRLTDSELAGATGEQQKTWKAIQEQATIGATALAKISDTQRKELTTEQEKDEADRVFGSQAMIYAESVYEMDQALQALRKLQQ